MVSNLCSLTRIDEFVSKPYPKLKIVRYLNVKKMQGRRLFGPYPNQYAARRVVNLINRLYLSQQFPMSDKEYVYTHIAIGDIIIDDISIDQIG